MTASYRDQKIREALMMAQGDQQQAQRVLLTWAQRDDKLLKMLVQPFLIGIVSHAIQHGGKIQPGTGTGARQRGRAGASLAPPKPLAPKALEGLIEQMGRNFEAKGPLGVAAPPAAAGRGSSARQADAMRALAEAFGKKRDR